MPANIWSFSCWSFLSCERISSLNAGEERERGGQREEQFNEVLKTDLEGSVINWLSQANTPSTFLAPFDALGFKVLLLSPFTPAGMQLHVNLTGCHLHPQNALPCASISLSTPL